MGCHISKAPLYLMNPLFYHHYLVSWVLRQPTFGAIWFLLCYTGRPANIYTKCCPLLSTNWASPAGNVAKCLKEGIKLGQTLSSAFAPFWISHIQSYLPLTRSFGHFPFHERGPLSLTFPYMFNILSFCRWGPTYPYLPGPQVPLPPHHT